MLFLIFDSEELKYQLLLNFTSQCLKAQIQVKQNGTWFYDKSNQTTIQT